MTAKLLQIMTKFSCKLRQLIYYKLQQFYYKLRQLLQIATSLLQITTAITNYDNYYKLQNIPYLKKIQKNVYHVSHHLISADISIFSPEISKFCYIKKYRYRLHFDT